jgi:peroxiredoxin
MNWIKSAFVSAFMTSLMAALGFSAWRLVQGSMSPAWWGVALASAVPVAFFMRLFLAPVARTTAALWWMPMAGVLGTTYAAMRAGLALPTLIAFVVGVVLPLIYSHWYSRFESRIGGPLEHGKALPAFSLQDADGRIVTSTELTRKTALWMFFRGNWCPFCMAQIREVAAQYRELSQRGVDVILISPQPQSHTQSLAQRFEVPMRFMTDVENLAASRLGILAKGGLPMGLQALGYDSDVPMPTVFITDPAGKIVYSDLTDNYRIRPEPADFIAALDRAGL